MSPGDPSNTADAEDAELRGGSSKPNDGSILLNREITGAILGAFYAVHSELGFGFLETVYENALTIVLKQSGLRIEQQVAYQVEFHGQIVGNYRADLVVESSVIVEIKAGRCLIPQHSAQLLNYLRASGLQVGLLLNFGEKGEFKRVIWTRKLPRYPTA